MQTSQEFGGVESGETDPENTAPVEWPNSNALAPDWEVFFL